MRLLSLRWLLVIAAVLAFGAGVLVSTAEASTASRWQDRAVFRGKLLRAAHAKHSFWHLERRQARRFNLSAGRRWETRLMVSSSRRLVRLRLSQVAFARRVVARHTPRSSRAGPSAWVLPRRVVLCESGGNPRAVNNSPAGRANHRPAGLYQIISPTWSAHGGLRFAPSADLASVWEQGVVALRILRSQGTRAWECW